MRFKGIMTQSSPSKAGILIVINKFLRDRCVFNLNHPDSRDYFSSKCAEKNTLSITVPFLSHYVSKDNTGSCLGDLKKEKKGLER